MSNTSQDIISNTQRNTITGWDEAITRADNEIKKLAQHVKRLKAARWTFMNSKKHGIPWPEGGLRGQEERFWNDAKEKDKSPRRAGAA